MARITPEKIPRITQVTAQLSEYENKYGVLARLVSKHGKIEGYDHIKAGSGVLKEIPARILGDPAFIHDVSMHGRTKDRWLNELLGLGEFMEKDEYGQQELPQAPVLDRHFVPAFKRAIREITAEREAELATLRKLMAAIKS